MTQHLFSASSGTDLQCARPECEVIVSDEALAAAWVPCPAPPCPAAAGDGRCVFDVDADGGVECSYCAQPPRTVTYS